MQFVKGTHKLDLLEKKKSWVAVNWKLKYLKYRWGINNSPAGIEPQSHKI